MKELPACRKGDSFVIVLFCMCVCVCGVRVPEGLSWSKEKERACFASHTEPDKVGRSAQRIERPWDFEWKVSKKWSVGNDMLISPKKKTLVCYVQIVSLSIYRQATGKWGDVQTGESGPYHSNDYVEYKRKLRRSRGFSTDLQMSVLEKFLSRLFLFIIF